MSFTLSKTALGIALALGSGVAFAANNATIEQHGNWNDSSVEQGDSQNATATVESWGDANVNHVLQTFVSNTTATIDTNMGSYNRNRITQYLVDDSSATINQSFMAKDNEATIDQHGVMLGFFPIVSRNLTATISQSGAYWGRWGNNDADITQTGNNADASISQTGSLNKADITQTALNFGSGMTKAEITQVGLNNDATVNQFGGRVSATVKQYGTGNSADVTQTNLFGLNQLNATVKQYGNYNTATIKQY